MSSSSNTVFALVIGINNYLAGPEAFAPLRGAVNDSRDFVRYLTDSRTKHGLGVAPENIIHLENAQATRSRIMSVFHAHFLENEKIPDGGDATMILFFAGHGARMKVRAEHDGENPEIEVICPVDERTLEENGNPVYAIPDYILGCLLAKLAKKKGPNITVILDSCHSGGMNRLPDADMEAGLPRAAWTASDEVPESLDSHLWSSGHATAKSYRLWAPSSTSHVLLAACRQDEIAREETHKDLSVHGRFTSKLLVRLRSLQLQNTTYEELIDVIPTWYRQTPHCGGTRRNRLVFEGNCAANGEYRVKWNEPSAEGNPSWQVNIGSVEGVVQGTEFTVRSPQDEFICVLVAQTVQASTSILVPADDQKRTWIPDGSRVVVSDWKSTPRVAHVYIPDVFPYANELFPSKLKHYQAGRLFLRAASEEVADLLLSLEADELIIEWRGNMVRQVQRQTRLKLDPQQVAHLPLIIDGLVHFVYFLQRHNSYDSMPGVSLEMHRLRGTRGVTRTPDPNFGNNGNLVTDGVVKLISDEAAVYGFTVRNESARDVYPYLFYFDPLQYTIQLWYEPPDSRAACPLSAHGSLTIGLGTENAFEFSLEPNESKSSGFLKLFVASQPLELKGIQQRESPLNTSFRGRQRGVEESVQLDLVKDVEAWDALEVLLTMTRSPS
ncbi:caspase domain-containing protein [Mycena metata]|uniref:Caspase domain-containing protein n=1 Tax=Mycena metata TaxID=1033252 RepID=A0AAD7IB22_9AGAR|nr:caspase domain-containing protein [Mycena metata]